MPKGAAPVPAPAAPAPQPADTWVLPAAPAPEPPTCSKTQKYDCTRSQCCLDAGMQCYEKNQYWAACKQTCEPGSLDPEDKGADRVPWTCRKLGARTPGRATPSNDGETEDEGTMLVRVRAAGRLPGVEEG